MLFASNRQRRDFVLPGVRRVRLKKCPPLFGEGIAPLTHVRGQALARGGAEAPGPSPQGRTARRNVLAHFSEATVMPRHLAGVMQAWTAWKQERDRQRAK